jgi:ribosomal protein L37AE/L43A
MRYPFDFHQYVCATMRYSQNYEQQMAEHQPHPACPSCARPMKPVRKGDAPAPLRSFRCRTCGTSFSEAAWMQSHSPDRALTLNFEATSRPN